MCVCLWVMGVHQWGTVSIFIPPSRDCGDNTELGGKFEGGSYKQGGILCKDKS